MRNESCDKIVITKFFVVVVVVVAMVKGVILLTS